MAEFNIPNKYNYTLMAGSSAWIAKRTSDVLGEYTLVGNLAEDVTMSVDLTRLEHMTNLYGLDTLDSNPVIMKKLDFNITIDEMIRENLEYALGSSGRVISQSIQVRKYAKAVVASGIVTVNGGSAIYDVEKVLPNSGEDTYDEGASGDYTVTEATGVITLTAGSAITEGDTIIVYYRVTKTVTEHPILDDPNINGAVEFYSVLASDNEVGYNVKIAFTNVDIALEGDLPLSKAEYLKATLKCSALADATSPTSKLGTYYTWRD